MITAPSRKRLTGFGLLGLAAASTSSYVHYKLLTDPSYTSFCDVNPSVSCTQAYLSRFGSMFGVPVALGGVFFFTVALLLTRAGRGKSESAGSVPGYLFAWSIVGFALVLYLAWASYVQLKTFCVLCAVTYVAVTAILIISARIPRPALTTLPRRAAHDLGSLVRSPLALLAVVLLAAGTAAVVGLFPREGTAVAQQPAYPPLTDQQRTDLEKWWAMQPKVDLPIPSDGSTVLIVKFSDYMCPACRQTYEWYKPVLGKYLSGGQVRYVVKHYPLEAECNPNAPSNHYASCEAAAAVLMARAKGTAQALEQWLFSNQASLTPDSVKKAARDIGGIQDFDAQYPKALEEVKMDAGMGGVLGINRTPTFYIAGRKLPGETILPPQYFDYLVELALKSPK